MVTELKRVSEIQVIYRPEFKAKERPQVGSAVDAYEILLSTGTRKELSTTKS